MSWASSLPTGVKQPLKRALASVQAWLNVMSNSYERAYERHARRESAESSVGGAEAFELIGRIELGLLRMEGIKPTDTIIDFGCGSGRLAVHLIPYLAKGRYVGIDISKTMLRNAAALTERSRSTCQVDWKHQTAAHFQLADGAADALCAFSVFTHLENEDSYRYLVDARRVVRPGGKLIFSCLPLSLAEARSIFLASARLDLRERWAGVRNVVTTEETMEALASLAGWQVARWYRGDERCIALAGMDGPRALGQSACVLIRPER
jgi:SAM-dependent methyltransferase